MRRPSPAPKVLLLVGALSAFACQKEGNEAPGAGGTAATTSAGGGNAGAGGGSAGKSAGAGGATAGVGAASGSGGSGVGGAAHGGTSGRMGVGGVSGGAGASGAAAGAGGMSGNSSGAGGSGPPPTGACAVTADRVRITEIDVGASTVYSEDEAALMPFAISPFPGGSRVAWMGSDTQVHVTTLDGSDQPSGASFGLPAHDFSDLYADANGGVLLLTRDAEGGGTLNCGEPTNLCGTPPDPPIACYDMYLVRFDGQSESWATKVTSSSADLPPYSTSQTGAEVFMIWWYAHHGRIAFDGANYAGYFGVAISISQSGCINIHQGDRMKVVDATGKLVTGGFDLGCSHSGYERMLWDATTNKFVTVCKTDNDNRIAFAPNYTTIYPVDLNYSNLGNIVTATGGGYWLTTSNIRAGEPAAMDGLADVHLLHFTTGAPDQDVVVASDAGLNDRAPHLAAYGADNLLAAWETSTKAGDLAANDGTRQLYVQARDRVTGAAVGDVVPVAVKGNRYQDFVAFPDGSVAYAAPGTSASKLQIVRILPCE